LPGVFSPEFSHSPDFIASKMVIPQGSRVLDLGCGTGILGFMAIIKGADKVVATDINPIAVKNTRINAEILEMEQRVSVVAGDCYEAVEGKFDVILLNTPYWDRPAHNNLEKAFFDNGHSFVRTALRKAKNILKKDGGVYLALSDQSNIPRIINEAYCADLDIKEIYFDRDDSPRHETHTRILLLLKKRSRRAKLRGHQ
jgi:release factor glutamine methyltransferase